MARGRMLNRSISSSLKMHQLPDDTARNLATWIIPHLDVNGVFYADPQMVKSRVFPRRTDVTTQQIDWYIKAMVEVGLIRLYEANGEPWMYWPGFDHNQPGLRTDRETPEYPLPTECRQRAGKVPPAPSAGNARESAGQNPATRGNRAPNCPRDSRLSEGEAEGDHE
ncbi:MAG: hypothetical protein M1546_08365, partial [Chloroflexi bacterium]|nr:hypothetical protein [Chloroflexota bacterium]